LKTQSISTFAIVPAVPRTSFRIALLAESCAAGVGRHVIDLAEHLQLQGHSIHIIYSDLHTDSRFCAGIKRLQALGVHTLSLSIAHSLHPSDLSNIGRIRSYLRSNGPFDVVHCHSTKAGLLGRIACLGSDSVSVYTPHAFLTMSPTISKMKRLSAQLLEWTLARMGHCIVCVSEEERAHASGIGIPLSKLRIVRNGIDLAEVQTFSSRRSEMRERWGVQPNQLVIGFVGRLADQKAPEMLITSFAQLAGNCAVPVKLVMVGSGPLREACEAQALTLGIRDQVVFEGGLPGPAAMSGFDIFALPSRYEGFPYVLLEAIATGLPIVATEVGGTADLVKSGVNGFVTPVGDPALFAAALSSVANDAQLRARMSEASKKLAKEFIVSKMTAEMSALYEKLLASTAKQELHVQVAHRSWPAEVHVETVAEKAS
jgi:glycosyltransferase involved in cell wall biosynthesis